MRQIALTKGEFALVDDKYYDELIKYTWHVNGKYVSNSFHTGSGSSRISSHLFMHYEVIRLAGKLIPKGYEIDHYNRNGLDNQETNLKIVTHTFNQINRGIPKNNTSGYPGVIYDSERNKWKASLKIGRERYTKRFDNQEEAEAARRQMEITYNCVRSKD